MKINHSSGRFTTVRNSRGSQLHREAEFMSIECEMFQETKHGLRGKRLEAEKEATELVRKKIFNIIHLVSIPASRKEELLDSIDGILSSRRTAFGKIIAFESELKKANVDIDIPEVQEAILSLKQIISDMTNPNRFYLT